MAKKYTILELIQMLHSANPNNEFAINELSKRKDIDIPALIMPFSDSEYYENASRVILFVDAKVLEPHFEELLWWVEDLNDYGTSNIIMALKKIPLENVLTRIESYFLKAVEIYKLGKTDDYLDCLSHYVFGCFKLENFPESYQYIYENLELYYFGPNGYKFPSGGAGGRTEA